VNEAGRSWKKHLSDALWAYRTTFKTPLGMTPYQLVHGKTCHLLVEVEHKAYWAIKKFNLDFSKVGKQRRQQISELEEWRNKEYHNAKIYKERTKRWHNKRLKKKEFAIGDKVLLFHSLVKLFGHGKLQRKWEGPFTVIEFAPHEAVTLKNDEGETLKVNGHCLKIFLEPDDKEYEIVKFAEGP
jgi:hypothetical protein